MSDETEWEKKNPGKPLPKGLQKGKDRAAAANQANDDAVEKGKKGGKLNLKVMRGTKGQGNRRGGK
jgi:hypothetical protein